MATIPALPFTGTQLRQALVDINDDANQVAPVAWTDVTGKPTNFTPSEHTHAISEVTGLQTALDGKQPTTTFKTVNGQVITGSGDIITALSFETEAEALAFSTANPGAAVFSTEVI